MRKRAELNHHSLSYIDAGTGEVILLLHGFCGNSGYWRLIFPEMAKDYRIIVPDLRGHGESGTPEGPYSMESFADDIAALLEKLNIPKATLLGHSMGGYITLAFAEKYPNLLNRFGLIHSTSFPDDEKGKEGRARNIALIRQQGMEAFIENLVPKLFAPAHLHHMTEAIDEVKRIGWLTNPNGAIASLEGMKARPDRTNILKETSLPVLLVAGADDQIIQPDRTFSADRPNITKFLIHGSGHMSMFEKPDQLLKGIKSFMSM